MDVNEHDKLSNITLIRNDMDVNEHEKPFNITLIRNDVSHVHLHPYHFL
jgi:hypothetical protein